MGYTSRSLGPGSTTLIQGDNISGYYGKVNNIITASELKEVTGINTGTLNYTGDITFLKFSHNYKTLYIADKCVISGISWDKLNSFDVIFGRVLVIKGVTYLVRSIQGSNINPSPNLSGSGFTDINLIGINNEWYNTIVKFTPNNIDSNWSGKYTWCQEIHSSSISNRVIVGNTSADYITYTGSISSSPDVFSWRPVLEVLSIGQNQYLLIKQNGKYYSIRPEHYDSISHSFAELTLSGGSEPNKEDLENFSFNNINEINNLMTVDNDSFRPVDKFNNIFELKIYNTK